MPVRSPACQVKVRSPVRAFTVGGIENKALLFDTVVKNNLINVKDPAGMGAAGAQPLSAVAVQFPVAVTFYPLSP